MDINKVILIGRLTRDCEFKSLSTTTVCNFSVAINRKIKDASGSWNDEVNYFDIELYGKQGEAIQGYLKKGKQVAVDGMLRQHRWESSDGQKRSRISVVAVNVQLLGGGVGGDSSGSGNVYNTQAQQTATPSSDKAQSDDFDDDIPF